MKKGILILLIIGLLLLPTVLAEDVQVLIEHKNIEKHTSNFKSIQSVTSQEKFEIKTISKEEFKKLKEDKSILIQEYIPKKIFLSESSPLIRASDTWDLKQDSVNITGNGQTVCILDTGAQTDHPALIGKNATCNIDCVSGSCTQNCSKTDPNGHGSHVAGIIASTDATYKGVTLNTKYIPVMVCNAAGGCSDSWVLDGIDWCIANKDTYNISVISMSLGGGNFSSYCPGELSYTERINNATNNNISVVVATGNDGYTTGISSPACIENATRVGNSYDANIGGISWGNPTICTDSSTFADKIVCSSNRGSFFTDTIFAPGAMITSTWNNSGFSTQGGTSMSTPHVSGVITLLNQYKKLESNKILTPLQIKNLLLESTEKVDDTANSGINYTRLDIFQTIMSSDEQTPTTNLITPNNSIAILTGNQIFSCNSTDNLQLKNLTLNLYNSTNLIYNITNSSPTNNILTINQTINLSETDTYTWNCISYDNNSNYNQTENRTITTESLISTITNPTNNTYTNQNETNFTCSSSSTQELSNITFLLYNSTQLIYNETKNISGLSNSTNFNFTLPDETNFTYNCESKNNLSQSDKTENYTIIYDNTKPQIVLTSPANNLNTTTKTHTFTYTETEINPSFCNLTINSEVQNSFTQTLGDGTYTWFINCTDLANNTNNSESRQLEIYTESTPAPSSGGGGGSSETIYTLKESETNEGISKKLRLKDKIRFSSNSNNHELTLNKINTDKVEVTIESDPITLVLYTNYPVKINLDNDSTFDLELTLESIISGHANIKIKTISEEIPKKTILTEELNKTEEVKSNTQNETETQDSPQKKSQFFKKILSIIDSILKFFGIKI